MKVYEGIGTGTVIGPKEVNVRVNLKMSSSAYPLKHILRHSPDGFNWGYGGSGPADLALAILTDLRGREFAERHYMAFKRVISQLDQDKDWSLPEALINQWLDREGLK